MGIREKIEKWLHDGQPYGAGVNIYMEHGPNAGLARRLTKHRASPRIPQYYRDKLRAGLLQIRAEFPPIEKDPPTADPAPQDPTPREETTTPTAKPAAREDEPDAVTILRKQARRLLKEQSATHTEMRLADSEAKRYELADRIMRKIVPEIDRIYDTIREWQRTGKLPRTAAQISEADRVRREAVELMQERAAIRTRLSRVRRAITKTTTKAERLSLEKQKAEQVDRLNEIEEILGL